LERAMQRINTTKPYPPFEQLGPWVARKVLVQHLISEYHRIEFREATLGVYRTFDSLRHEWNCQLSMLPLLLLLQICPRLQVIRLTHR